MMIYNKDELKEEYKELIEHSLNLIFIIDLKGNFIDANDITLNTLGYEKKDLTQLSIKDLLDEVQLKRAFNNIQELTSTGWQIKFSEFKVKTKEGDFVYIATNGIPLKRNNQTYAILVMANDITKQKLTEQKLKRSQRKYRSLFKRIPYSIFLLNFDGIIIDCNSKSEYLFGYKKYEMIGRHFKNLPIIDPTFLPTLLERFKKLLKGENSLPIEVRMYKKDEGLIWASLEATLVQIGDIQYVQVIIQDISDQKRVEKSLKESEELYRELYNNALVGLCTINIKDGRFITANYLSAKVMGYENITDLLKHHKVDDIFNDTTRKNFIKKLKIGGEIFSYDVLFHDIKGNEKEISIWAKLNKNEDLVNISFIDITDLKKMQKALQESGEKYHHLFESAPFLIGLIDLNGNIIDLNSGIKSILTNRTKKDIIGKNITELFSIHEKEKALIPLFQEKIKKLVNGEIVKPFEVPFYRSNGGIQWVNIQGSLMKIENKPLIQLIIQDITEKKEAEQKLKESEERYRHLFESSPFIIGLLDLKGNLIDVSSAIKNFITHRTKKDLVGKNITEIFSINEKEKPIIPLLKEQIKQLENGENIRDLEVPFYRSNGSVQWVNIQGSLMKIQNKHLFQLIVQDITKKKEAEQKLKESEVKFRKIIENSYEGYYEVDLAGNFTFFNDALSKLLEYSPDELMGMNYRSFMSKEIAKKTYEIFHNIYNTGIEQRDYEAMIITKGSKNVYVTYIINLRYDSEGNKIGFSGFLRDITEKKIAVQKLSESELKYRYWFQRAPFVFGLLDIEGNIVDINSAINNFFTNQTHKDLIGKNIFRDILSLHEKEKLLIPIVKERLNKLLEGEPFHSLEAQFYRSDGKVRWADMQASLLKFENKTLIQFILRDITEKKEAEQKLSESELKYRNLFQRAPFVICLMDIEGNILDINTAINNYLTNRTSKDIIGKNIIEIYSIHEKEKSLIPIIQERIKKLLKGEILQPFEHAMYRSDGRIQWVEEECTLLKFENKTLIQFLMRDVTEKKEAEQKLRESEVKYRNIIENAKEGYYEVDLAGNLTFFNDALCELSEYSPEELMGMNNRNLMTKDTAKKTFEVFNTVFNTGIAQKNYEFEVVSKSGKIVYGDSTIHLRHDDKGNKIGFSAFTRDITEKKLAEQKLEKSEKQFRSIFESIPDIYFLLSGDSTILEYKGKMEDFYIPPEQFLGKKMKDILPPEVGKLGFEAIQKTLQTKEPTIIDYSLPVGGENRFYEARILYYNSERVIIFIREITDRKKAELIIQEEFSKLKELEQIRKDLISRVSHELKTPLIPVISGTELISTVYKDQIGEQAKDIVEMIHNGGLRLKELIEKLISVSRIEYKKLILNKEKTNLCELIKKSAADMKYLLEIRNLDLDMNIPEEFYLEIDKIRIEEVITNFLSNAIKNTPPNGKIFINLKEEKEWAILSVGDTGVGLTEEEMKILFTRFGKIDRFKEGLEYLDIKGSGLGLYICKEIIDLHRGQIWAQSEGRHKGSTFYIKLPLNET